MGFLQTRDGMSGLIVGIAVAMLICLFNLIFYMLVEMAGPEAQTQFTPVIAIIIQLIWLIVVVVLLLVFVHYRNKMPRDYY